MTFARCEADAVYLEVHVQPGARVNAVVGIHGTRLKLKIAAPAVEGAANKAVCAFIAELFEIPLARVQIARGERSRQKTVVVRGAASLPASIAVLADHTAS